MMKDMLRNDDDDDDDDDKSIIVRPHSWHPGQDTANATIFRPRGSIRVVLILDPWIPNISASRSLIA